MSRKVAALACVTGLLLCALGHGVSRAEKPLTEEDVLRFARERAPRARLAASSEEAAATTAESVGLWPDPSLQWEREALVTGQNADQDILRVTVPVDPFSPGIRRSIASAQLGRARADAALERALSGEEMLLVFYEVAFAEERLHLLEESLESLEEAGRVLVSREKAGAASGYESTRLAVATELAKSELGLVRAQVSSSRAKLGAMLDLSPAVPIAANLAPAPLGTSKKDLAARDDLRHARQAAEVAAEGRERAKRAWVPTLSFSAGGILMRDGDTRYGYVAGISFSLPLFSGGQGVRAQAAAEELAARARLVAAEKTANADITGAEELAEQTAAELARFESATKGDVEVLVRAAASGYRQGERTILELLDAQRARTEVALRRLELQAVRKRAEIQLRRARGELK